VFQGLREDKRATDVVRERAVALDGVRDDSAVAGVRLTHPDRVLWPDAGVTKYELARYYDAVASWMLPHVVERPLSLLRAPDGIDGEQFFHKHVGKGWPAAIRRAPVRQGMREVTYVAVADVAGLVALAQMDVVEIHPWGARLDRIEQPDRMILDLDPDPELPWRRLVEAAAHTRLALHDAGLTSFVKTTGGKGLHVVVPIVRRLSWPEVKTTAAAWARALAIREPSLFTASMSKEARRGKVYVDYVRNARGQTAVAAFSTRARPGATVSTPVRWDELLGETSASHWTVRNLPRRLAALRGDPWGGFADLRQSLRGPVEAPKGTR
jgi:bifunctional non-homologous end joining protein LigD